MWGLTATMPVYAQEQVILPYLSTGYRYQVVPYNGGAGFEQPSFNDSGFTLGNAAFGLEPLQHYGCPLDATAQTLWDVGTDILLRKTFTLPATVSNVKVAVAIDNDVQVFINGVDISGGLQIHEFCAERDSLIFPVPATILHFGGINVLAVRARDRGGDTYVDVEVRAGQPITDGTGPTTSNVVINPNPVAVNTSFPLTARVDDTFTGGSNIAAAHYSIDGGSSMAMAAQDGGFNAVSEPVVATVSPFSQAGVHEFCVHGTDAAGNSGDVVCVLVAVYDPTAGFVTGGGWITSPPGAYAPDPAATGRANFGFVSKYQKGATIPTGTTEFHFNAAELNFHSDTYEWLVIAGARAQYKGTGTLNDLGNYGFLLTAIDGQVSGGGGTDKFRIKIWDKNHSDTIVYDNQWGASDTGDPTTVIGGGSIVIHAK